MESSSLLIDPLRGARQAVQRGRFGDAVVQLEALESRWASTPEWLLLMAMASWRLGNFAESHRLAKQARWEYRMRGDTDGEMRAQNVAAAGAFALGQLWTAREGFERASYLARQLSGTLMLARCTNNIGNVDFHLGNNTRALALYRKAASLFEQAGSLRGTAEAWHNLGTVLREEGDLTAASKVTDRAVDAAEVLGEMRLVGQTLGGRGETDAMLGDLRLGSAKVTRAYEIARELDDRLTECESLRVLGVIGRVSGDTSEAVKQGSRATKIAEEVANQWMLAKTKEELGQTLLVAKRQEEAYASFAEAETAYAILGAEIRSDRMHQMLEEISSSS